jgi:hypothetical protein
VSGTNSDEIPDKVYKKGLRIQKEQFFKLIGRLATSFPSEFRAFCVGQESKQSDIDGLVVTNTGLMKEIATLEEKATNATKAFVYSIASKVKLEDELAAEKEKVKRLREALDTIARCSDDPAISTCAKHAIADTKEE